MRWGIARLGILIACFANGMACAQEAPDPTEPWPFTAAFVGTGRICYGGLFIRERTISWLTTYSQCQKIPYEVLEHRAEGNERHIVFRLQKKPPYCRHRIIYLMHVDKPNFGIGWGAIGFETLQQLQDARKVDWTAKPASSQWCYLYVK